jgi:hypothetical protein
LRPILPFLLLLTPALPAAEAVNPPPRKKLSAISLLPDGSELIGVMLPRYDENHRIVGVLKAATITLVNEEIVAGKSVTIGFSNPDGSPRGHIDLAKANFNQVKGLLEASEPVTLQSTRFHAEGAGLYYAFNQGEGFLPGPATTWILAPNESPTTMNSSSSTIRATALAGIALASQSLAQPPASPNDSLKADTAPASSEHSSAARSARLDLRTDLAAAAAATAKAKAFLEQTELVSANPTEASPPTPEATPLDVQPGPKDTLISCDGGMYFDADQGVFVYLKNVRVTDPRFSLSGANELKIFLAQKPAAKPAADKPAGIGLGAKFGDVDRIIATGAVRILQKNIADDKPPVEASGAIFTYHAKTGQIILSGGYPWVKQGTTFMRAKQPNLTLRIQKSGSFVTEGNWDMGGSLESK